MKTITYVCDFCGESEMRAYQCRDVEAIPIMPVLYKDACVDCRALMEKQLMKICGENKKVWDDTLRDG